MKKQILVAVMACIGLAAQGQVFDTYIMRYKYVFSYQMDSLNNNTKGSDIMILKIGHKTSLYYSEAARIGDSIEHVDAQKGDMQLIAANRGKYNKSKSRTVIVKNYPKNKMTVGENIFIDDYKYTEPLTGQQWKIVDDTATMYGLLCQKAVTRFRGRNYEAWFTKSIPVANGPWKFYGLPGLMVKVYDTKHLFSFEFNGIVLPQKNELMEIGYKQYTPASRKQVWELRKEMHTHPYAFADNVLNNMKGFVNYDANGQAKPLKWNRPDPPVPFNPIELE